MANSELTVRSDQAEISEKKTLPDLLLHKNLWKQIHEISMRTYIPNNNFNYEKSTIVRASASVLIKVYQVHGPKRPDDNFARKVFRIALIPLLRDEIFQRFVRSSRKRQIYVERENHSRSSPFPLSPSSLSTELFLYPTEHARRHFKRGETSSCNNANSQHFTSEGCVAYSIHE